MRHSYTSYSVESEKRKNLYIQFAYEFIYSSNSRIMDCHRKMCVCPALCLSCLWSCVRYARMEYGWMSCKNKRMAVDQSAQIANSVVDCNLSIVFLSLMRAFLACHRTKWQNTSFHLLTYCLFLVTLRVAVIRLLGNMWTGGQSIAEHWWLPWAQRYEKLCVSKRLLVLSHFK